MKKVFAIVTAVALLFVISTAVASPTSFFTGTDDGELDLSQYNLNEMSLEEINDLIHEYERVYDPFGSYGR